ncbi:hypothetical protein LCGC14_1121300 [marine sediment metagenome]|uniref:Uncharacterized protein n=1 Tax=marine sediment metagenome TaxID=412755 RepID=A0A0F9M8M6_9ZZZZ
MVKWVRGLLDNIVTTLIVTASVAAVGLLVIKFRDQLLNLYYRIISSLLI